MATARQFRIARVRVSFLGAAALALVVALGLSATPAQAQDAAAPGITSDTSQAMPDVPNANHAIIGVVNATGVYVRSGPGDNYHPAAQLDKGAQVTVVGKKFTWLKIVPPEGCFCYVPKVYVNKHGDGSVGQIVRRQSDAPVIVRAGSTVNVVGEPVSKLSEGAEVKILDEYNEYYKIKPPTDAYFYISEQYVDPVKPAGDAAAAAPAASGDAAAPQPTAAATAGKTPTDAGSARVAPETAQTPAPDSAAKAPEAKAEPAAAEQYDKLEAQYAEIAKKPVLDAPIEDLLAAYQTLAKDEKLDASMRRVVDVRVKILQARADARQQYAAVKKTQDETAAKAKSLTAERDELEQRAKQTDVQTYAAIGMLRESSLQQGAVPLYRLVDPGTGHTLVYVRSNDSKISGMLGQFVGLRGDVLNDQQLQAKVITPTDVDAIDASQLYRKAIAPIAPPSLVPRGGPTTATTDGR
jgi:uncharacterized protein YraI